MVPRRVGGVQRQRRVGVRSDMRGSAWAAVCRLACPALGVRRCPMRLRRCHRVLRQRTLRNDPAETRVLRHEAVRKNNITSILF